MSTPLLDGSPTKRLGMLQSVSVPVKGVKDNIDDDDDVDGNHFVGSKSLPDFEAGYFDRVMKTSVKDVHALSLIHI